MSRKANKAHALDAGLRVGVSIEHLWPAPVMRNVGVMSNKRSDNHLPEEVLGFLSSIFFMPVIPVIAMLTAMLLPSVTSPRGEIITSLYWVGVAGGVFGIVLLFLARLPLYRQRRFLNFGPRGLDRIHRRLYWLAYLVVLVSMGLFAIVWLRLR
jgi:hypothetical protein